MTTSADSELADDESYSAKNIPCDQCRCFTIDYKFHTGAPIPLDGRLAHRLSYTNDDRYFFKLPWLRKDVWPKLPGLQASFSAGCLLCGVLRANLSTERFQPPDPAAAASDITIKAEFGFQEPFQRKPTGVRFDCQFAGQSQWHVTAQQPTFILAAARDSPASRQYRNLQAPDPLSPDNQIMIREWIKECGETHKYCKTQVDQPFPTRLIDVRPDNPRLVLTKGDTGVYATLSYCWGLSPENPFESMYTTTEATVQARMEGMLFEDMPKTLQDAVLVTRALGLQYLWIDALCIIQDSKLDVKNEIKSMVSVYGNCEVVICATNAISSKAGFLNPRGELQPLVTMSFIPSEGGEVGSYAFYDTKSFPKRNNWGSVESSEWNTRAWTFQERVISPRVLHFGKDTVHFECRTSDLSELGCSPRQLVVGNSVFGTDYRYLGVSEYLSSQDPLDMSEIYETFYKFACQYSKRMLTSEADRESAFSAVMAQFSQKLTGSEHIHGLWIDDIWRSLLWNFWGPRGDDTSKNNTITRRKDLDPGPTWPSWSWYSYPDPISWNSTSKIWKSITPQSLSPQGNNSPTLISFTRSPPSKLVISAVLRPVDSNPTGRFSPIVVDGENCGTIQFDTAPDSNTKEHEGEGAEPPPPIKIQLLQLRNKFQIYNEDGDITGCSTAGLVLHPAAGGSDDCYLRMGTFSISSLAKWEVLFENQKQSVITLV